MRRPSPAEVGLLELARELGATPAKPGEREALVRALALLEVAFRPGASLPRHLAQAWLRTRGDKTASLALGWAREQVRRALADVVRGLRRPGHRDEEVPADTAAWLLLAAAEGESHEVGGSVGDRLSMLCALLALR
jgi:hypothetical protein